MKKRSFKTIVRDIVFLLLILILVYYLFFINRSLLHRVLQFMFWGGLLYIFYSAIGKYIYCIPFSEWRNSDRIVFIIALSCFLFASGAMLEMKSSEYFSELDVQNNASKFKWEKYTDSTDPSNSFDTSKSNESFAFPDTVWHNDSSGIYHCIEHCEGTQNAKEYSLEDMEELGIKPCKRCFIYITENGSCYHDDPECSGMIDPIQVPITSMGDSSYAPCSKCYDSHINTDNTNCESHYGPSNSSDISKYDLDFTDMLEATKEEYEKYLNGEYDDYIYVYVTTNGNCYHRSSSCNGLKYPEKITISEAKSRGYNPCATCQP